MYVCEREKYIVDIDIQTERERKRGGWGVEEEKKGGRKSQRSCLKNECP